MSLEELSERNVSADLKKSKKKKSAKKEPKPKAAQPKRAMVPKTVDIHKISLEEALGYLYLPRLLGNDAEGHAIKAGMGRFGPYVVKSGAGLEKPEYRSLKKEDNVLTVNLERALQIFAEPKLGRGGRRRAAPLRALGKHPQDETPIELFDGPYGPYVKCGKINASLPKEKKPEDLSLEEAVQLIEARR